MYLCHSTIIHAYPCLHGQCEGVAFTGVSPSDGGVFYACQSQRWRGGLYAR